MGYQERDWEILDYQGYLLEDTGLWFRGPQPKNLKKGEYFVCIGAAQTFGCFCEKPYPTLLQEKLGLPALNLGYGGAGPYFFLLNNRKLLRYINNAKFSIIQVMSGRSENNSLFDSGGLEYLTRRSDGVKIGSRDAYKELIQGYAGNRRHTLLQKRYIRKIYAYFRRNHIKKVVAETRHNWTINYKKLLEEFEIPKILFWFSKREPEYQEKYTNVYSLFGGFPHLVNSHMINEIRKYSDEYVECISSRGSPQLLISRFTGKPTTIDPSDARKDLGTGKRLDYNSYYPSPEMQIDAANALESICKKYYD